MSPRTRANASMTGLDPAALLAGFPGGAAVLDRNGSVMAANEALEALAGSEPLAGRTVSELSARLKGLHLPGRFARFLATRERSSACETVSCGAAAPGGTLCIVLAPLAAPPGASLLTIEDITGREAPAASEDHPLEAAAQASDDAVLGVSSEGAICTWNRGARRIFGYPDRELGGRPLDDLLPEEAGARRLHPSALAKSGAVRNAQTRGRTKSGRDIPVLVTATPMEGGEKLPAASLVIKDLTELHELQAKTLEAERLKTVLQTVVSLNHEINNPLAIMMGNLQLLLRSFANGPATTLGRLESTYEAGGRIAEVIRRLTNLVEPVETEYLRGRGIRMIDLRRSRAR